MYGIGSLALGAPGKLTVLQRAIALLRKFGTNAHVYLPGVGTLNGLQAANYLDSAGTTQGTVDQPVGLALDAEGVLGVELVTNGDFSAGATGWTLTGGWSVSGGTAQNSGTLGSITQTVGTLTIGKSYVATFNCTSTLTLNAVFGGAYVTITPVIGLNTVFGVCTGSTALAFQGANVTTGIDNVSCKEITGIHARQSTTPAKPVLRRGAVNLLQYSQDFTNAAWVKVTSSITATGINDPFGGTSAVTLTASASTGILYQTVSSFTGIGAIWIRRRSGSGDIQLGGADNANYTAVGVNGNWQLFVYPGGAKTGVFGLILQIVGNGDSVDICFGGAFTGTYTASDIIKLGGIPLTTTAPASTALGPYFWQFDGVDDSLSLSGPLFQMSDDHCVIAGVRFTNPAMYPSVLTAAIGSPAAVCRMYADSPEWGGKLVVAYTNDAGTTTAAIASAYIAGSDVVFTSTKQGGFCRADMDMAQGTPVAAPAGVFTVGNGSIGGVIAGGVGAIVSVKGSVSSADLITLKRFVASLQGRSI
jgi:hypothetical protein